MKGESPSEYDDGPLTEPERLHLLREFGRRSGWDEPEMTSIMICPESRTA